MTPAFFVLLVVLASVAVVIVRSCRRDATATDTQQPWLKLGRVRISFLALVVAGVLLGAWISGTFDRALVHVGLNYNECATNAFGATFCGEDIDSYRRQFDPSYGTEPAEQTYEECRDKEMDYGSTFAEAQEMCSDLR